jgi:putative flippase GtrA
VSPGRRRIGVLWQFTSFVVVGASNTAISLVSYTVLLWAGVAYALAGAIAYVLGAVNGYVLNRRWTFSAHDTTARRMKYGVVQVAALGVTTALLWLLVSVGDVGRIAAYALAVPVVTVGTFLASRGWVFRGAQPPRSAHVSRAPP